MERQFLVDLGLTDKSTIDAIMAENGKDIEKHKGNSDKLTADFNAKDAEHKEALALIEKLKGENAGNEKLQASVKDYETKVAALTKENEQLKIDKAVEIALLENKAKASDIDYLMFKIKAEHKDLALDENGKVKGIDDIISGAKTSYAGNFETVAKKTYEPNKLPKGEPTEAEPTSLVEAIAAQYGKQ
ncbi:MAG: phage scaffolding protein [Clostridia bacterium]|nr:phage scaffolding protein [Clostridia bacterium]